MKVKQTTLSLVSYLDYQWYKKMSISLPIDIPFVNSVGIVFYGLYICQIIEI